MPPAQQQAQPTQNPPAPQPPVPAQNSANISGSELDKADAEKMKEAIKAQSNLSSSPTVPTEQIQPKGQMAEDDEMYIDKDGNIHYKEE